MWPSRVSKKRSQRFPQVPSSRTPRACATCRKNKQRCDALDKFPDSCTRCQRRGQVCQFERGGVTQNSNNNSLAPATSSEDTAARTSKSQTSSSSSESTNNQSYLVDIPAAELPFPIEDDELIQGQVISKEDLKKLYVTYFEKYHYLLPVITKEVLLPTTTPNLGNLTDPPVFRDHKPLFWAICLIASPTANEELQKPLLKQVQEVVFQGLSVQETLLKGSESLCIILALVILSYWYIGLRGISEDRSYMFSGSALRLGLQLGFNHPENRHSFQLHPVFFTTVESRALAWMGICIVCNLSSMTYGFPVAIPSDRYYHKLFQDNDNANKNPYFHELENQLLVLRQYRIFSRRIVENDDANFDSVYGTSPPESRGPIYKAFNETFSSLLSRLSPMNAITELVSLYCKLHMNLLLLLPDALEKDTQNAIVPIYITCCQTSHVLSRLLDNTDITPATLPMFIKQHLVYCIIVLYRILSSDYQELVERENVLNCISDLYRFAKRIEYTSSDDKSTQNVWGSKVIEMIQTMYSEKKISSTLCSIGARQSAGLFFTTALEVFNWNIENGKLNNNRVAELIDKSRKINNNNGSSSQEDQQQQEDNGHGSQASVNNPSSDKEQQHNLLTDLFQFSEMSSFDLTDFDQLFLNS